MPRNEALRQLSLFDLPRGEPAAPAVRVTPPRNEVLTKAESLARKLSAELGVAVRLAVTDNRSTMVSYRRATSALRLRLHHMFLDAPEGVVRAIADYAGRGQRRAGPVLDEYIRVRQDYAAQNQIFKLGTGENITPTADFTAVTFQDPYGGGYTYAALKPNATTATLSSAVVMVEKAKAYDVIIKSTTATAAEKAKADAGLRETVRSLEMMRGLYAIFSQTW